MNSITNNMNSGRSSIVIERIKKVKYLNLN